MALISEKIIHLFAIFAVARLANSKNLDTDSKNVPNTISLNDVDNCKDGWIYAASLGCLYFNPDVNNVNLSWVQAQGQCETIDGALLEILNEEEQEFIKTEIMFIQNFIGEQRWWIGATDLGRESEWIWMNSRRPVSYTSWAPQRPNTNDGNLHDCSLLDCTNNFDCDWKDTTCGEDINKEYPISFICQSSSGDEKTTTDEPVTTPSAQPSPIPTTTTVTSRPITTTVQPDFEFMPINAYECPCTDEVPGGCNLAECLSDTKLNALCEADQTLPDGNPDFDVDNCPGSFDVFRRISKDSSTIKPTTSQQPTFYPTTTTASSCAGVAEGWAISYNGLTWAWASPCSGKCGGPDPNQSPGYRFATTSECAKKPSNSDFNSNDESSPYYYDGVKCAALIFDPQWSKCDVKDPLVCELNGHNYETLLVCG